ncbi:MAG: hypothetical protein NVS2B14_01270 [Chamaesiphon sp.]
MTQQQLGTPSNPCTVVPLAPKVEYVLPANRSELRRLLASGHNRGWRRPLTDITADLCRPLPDGFIGWFQKKATWIPYVSWTDINLILDYIAPGWGLDVSESQVGDRVVVKSTLTILCEEGEVQRSSLGSDELADEMFGGPLPDAESQGFRRAAARFGLGLYLYDKSVVDALKRRFQKS